MSHEIQRIGMAARYSEAAVFNGVVYLAGMVPERGDSDITGQTADVLFVTARDGRYLFADNRLLSSVIDFGNPIGVIHVQ